MAWQYTRPLLSSEPLENYTGRLEFELVAEDSPREFGGKCLADSQVLCCRGIAGGRIALAADGCLEGRSCASCKGLHLDVDN